jgi:SAM-dependent methyltransferase
MVHNTNVYYRLTHTSAGSPMTSQEEIDESVTRKRWNDIYTSFDAVLTVDETMPRIVDLFVEYNVKTVLDLGCGGGRHTVYLEQEGFDVYGIDIAGEGVKKAYHLLTEKGLGAALSIGSIRNLPYRNNSFDSLISVRVIHHGRIEAIRKTIKEIERVVKPRGLIFVTVRKRVHKKERRPSTEIAPRTYVPVEGREKDIVHYLFTKEILKREFKNFKILDLQVDSDRYYCLTGEKKE